jgi:hypothetical protein
MVYDLNVFQIVFNHKQFENKKTGLKIEGVSDCCITPNEQRNETKFFQNEM